MSKRVTELIKQYQRRLILRRHAIATPDPGFPAPKPKRKLEPHRPDAKPHVPASDHRLRESHL
jgi:hypothetical protein